MKSTGIVRRIDELGRIVIPKELRRTYEIAEGDPMEIFTDENKIVLRKYKPEKSCMICGSMDQVKTSHDCKISICQECAKKALNMFEE